MKLFGQTIAFRPFLPVLLGAACVCLSSAAQAAETQGAGQAVTRAGTYAPAKAPASSFTGSVRVERIFKASEEAPYTAAVSPLSRVPAPSGIPMLPGSI